MTRLSEQELTSLRDWLAHWGDGPNWSDPSGVTIPIAKTTAIQLVNQSIAAGEMRLTDDDRWLLSRIRHLANVWLDGSTRDDALALIDRLVREPAP